MRMESGKIKKWEGKKRKNFEKTLSSRIEPASTDEASNTSTTRLSDPSMRITHT